MNKSPTKWVRKEIGQWKTGSISLKTLELIVKTGNTLLDSKTWRDVRFQILTDLGECRFVMDGEREETIEEYEVRLMLEGLPKT